MEDNLNFLTMEDDLKYLKMEDYLKYLKMEDDLIFLELKDDLNFIRDIPKWSMSGTLKKLLLFLNINEFPIYFPGYY